MDVSGGVFTSGVRAPLKYTSCVSSILRIRNILTTCAHSIFAGAFGSVYKGEILPKSENGNKLRNMKVAIKTIKSKFS